MNQEVESSRQNGQYNRHDYMTVLLIRLPLTNASKTRENVEYSESLKRLNQAFRKEAESVDENEKGVGGWREKRGQVTVVVAEVSTQEEGGGYGDHPEHQHATKEVVDHLKMEGRG